MNNDERLMLLAEIENLTPRIEQANDWREAEQLRVERQQLIDSDEILELAASLLLV